MTLKINSKAPSFEIPATSVGKYSLKNSIGKYLVLYFYPKDDTPGCTIETNDFNKLLSKFKKLDCEIYGISKDSLKSHEKFKDKYKIKFDLLADEEVFIRRITLDKYGRTVGELSFNGENLQQLLVKEGHAEIYKKYSKPCEWAS